KCGSRKSLNSGLLFYDLKRMRAGGWDDMWRQSALMLLGKIRILTCPQDVLAAVATSRPETYMQLPCVYNFQIGKGALQWDCIKNETDLLQAKIPHWTGTKKYYENRGHTAVFSPIYRCFQKMDGYNFEEPNGAGNYRTLMNLRNIKRTATEGNVTLATHAPYVDAIQLIQRLNVTWSGPISLAI
ncbi:hypothetical protein PMAYCL1PPCAC_13501, partial [Pristionchus mayeri]